MGVVVSAKGKLRQRLEGTAEVMDLKSIGGAVFTLVLWLVLHVGGAVPDPIRCSLRAYF